MIVVQELSLIVACIILGWILFSDFEDTRIVKHSYTSCGVFDGVFHADAETNVHPLPVYILVLVCLGNIYFLGHIWCLLCLAADAVSPGSWFKPGVSSPNIKYCYVNTVCYIGFGRCIWFLNTAARALNSADRALCLPAWKTMQLVGMV